MLVSVIIPVYNAAKTIEKCIISIINQSIPSKNYEIIIADNGSTDQTKSILKKYPVRYVFQPVPSVYKARNAGFEISSGKIIAFIDGDCVASKDWLKHGISTMNKCLIAKGSMASKFSNRKTLFLYDQIITWMPPRNSDFNINAGNCFIDRRLFKEIGGFDETIDTAGDSIFSMIAKQKGYHIGFIPEATVYHPVEPIVKRFKRSLREGTGAEIKDPYRYENYKIITKVDFAKIKIINLLKNQYNIIKLLNSKRKTGIISTINHNQLLALHFLLISFDYIGIIAVKAFPVIKEKWAVK